MQSRHTLFYIGLLPLCVLIFLWGLSMKLGYAWTRAQRDQEMVTAISDRSHLYISHYRIIERRERPGSAIHSGVPLSTGPWGIFRNYVANFGCQPEPRTWFPRFHYTGWDDDSHFYLMRRSHTSIPYWLLVLAYLPPWLGIAWWQHGRKRPKKLTYPNSLSTSDKRFR